MINYFPKYTVRKEKTMFKYCLQQQTLYLPICVQVLVVIFAILSQRVQLPWDSLTSRVRKAPLQLTYNL